MKDPHDLPAAEAATVVSEAMFVSNFGGIQSAGTVGPVHIENLNAGETRLSLAEGEHDRSIVQTIAMNTPVLIKDQTYL